MLAEQSEEFRAQGRRAGTGRLVHRQQTGRSGQVERYDVAGNQCGKPRHHHAGEALRAALGADVRHRLECESIVVLG